MLSVVPGCTKGYGQGEFKWTGGEDGEWFGKRHGQYDRRTDNAYVPTEDEVPE